MDILKTLYPTAFKAKDVNSLIIALIVYIVLDVLCGLILGLLTKLPIVGFLFGIVGALIGLYALLGIALSLLIYFKIMKD